MKALLHSQLLKRQRNDRQCIDEVQLLVGTQAISFIRYRF